MNRLLDPNLWRDSDNNTPPIQWNAESSRYEFLTQSEDGVALVGILYQFEVPGAEAGDVIAFDYEVSQFVVNGDHQTTLYLQEDSTGTVVWSVVVNALPSGSVEIECTPGELYQFIMEREGGLTPTVYDFQAIITPTPDPAPPEPTACEELGRVTRVYVSAYQRTRIHESRIHRGERRCLVANFNGAIPASRTIASATWRTYANNTAGMANARIVGRDVMVDLEGLYAGCAPIRLEATLDNGERYVQEFVVRVEDIGWFPGEPQPSAGPTTVTVTA